MINFISPLHGIAQEPEKNSKIKSNTINNEMEKSLANRLMMTN